MAQGEAIQIEEKCPKATVTFSTGRHEDLEQPRPPERAAEGAVEEVPQRSRLLGLRLCEGGRSQGKMQVRAEAKEEVMADWICPHLEVPCDYAQTCAGKLSAEVERLKGVNTTLQASVGKKGKAFVANLIALRECREALKLHDPRHPEHAFRLTDPCQLCAALSRTESPAAMLEAHDREVKAGIWKEAARRMKAQPRNFWPEMFIQYAAALRNESKR